MKPTFKRYQIARNMGTGRTSLITVNTKTGRLEETLAHVLNGWEGDTKRAIAACENGDTQDGIRIFCNRP